MSGRMAQAPVSLLAAVDPTTIRNITQRTAATIAGNSATLED